ncbi:TPA: hypothetical protein ACU6JA_005170 [Salmonella enterica]
MSKFAFILTRVTTRLDTYGLRVVDLIFLRFLCVGYSVGKIISSAKKILGLVCVLLIVIVAKIIGQEFGKEYVNDYTKKTLYSEGESLNDLFNNSLKQKKFPMIIDENTILINIVAQGKYVNYYYILYGLDGTDFDSESFKKEIYNNVKNDMHGTDFCAFLIKYSYTAKYIYKFQDGSKPDVIIYLTYKDC